MVETTGGGDNGGAGSRGGAGPPAGGPVPPAGPAPAAGASRAAPAGVARHATPRAAAEPTTPTFMGPASKYLRKLQRRARPSALTGHQHRGRKIFAAAPLLRAAAAGLPASKTARWVIDVKSLSLSCLLAKRLRRSSRLRLAKALLQQNKGDDKTLKLLEEFSNILLYRLQRRRDLCELAKVIRERGGTVVLVFDQRVAGGLKSRAVWKPPRQRYRHWSNKSLKEAIQYTGWSEPVIGAAKDAFSKFFKGNTMAMLVAENEADSAYRRMALFSTGDVVSVSLDRDWLLACPPLNGRLLGCHLSRAEGDFSLTWLDTSQIASLNLGVEAARQSPRAAALVLLVLRLLSGDGDVSLARLGTGIGLGSVLNWARTADVGVLLHKIQEILVSLDRDTPDMLRDVLGRIAEAVMTYFQETLTKMTQTTRVTAALSQLNQADFLDKLCRALFWELDVYVDEDVAMTDAEDADEDEAMENAEDADEDEAMEDAELVPEVVPEGKRASYVARRNLRGLFSKILALFVVMVVRQQTLGTPWDELARFEHCEVPTEESSNMFDECPNLLKDDFPRKFLCEEPERVVVLGPVVVFKVVPPPGWAPKAWIERLQRRMSALDRAPRRRGLWPTHHTQRRRLCHVFKHLFRALTRRHGNCLDADIRLLCDAASDVLLVASPSWTLELTQARILRRWDLASHFEQRPAFEPFETDFDPVVGLSCLLHVLEVDPDDNPAPDFPCLVRLSEALADELSLLDEDADVGPGRQRLLRFFSCTTSPDGDARALAESAADAVINAIEVKIKALPLDQQQLEVIVTYKTRVDAFFGAKSELAKLDLGKKRRRRDKAKPKTKIPKTGRNASLHEGRGGARRPTKSSKPSEKVVTVTLPLGRLSLAQSTEAKAAVQIVGCHALELLLRTLSWALDGTSSVVWPLLYASPAQLRQRISPSDELDTAHTGRGAEQLAVCCTVAKKVAVPFDDLELSKGDPLLTLEVFFQLCEKGHDKTALEHFKSAFSSGTDGILPNSVALSYQPFGREQVGSPYFPCASNFAWTHLGTHLANIRVFGVSAVVRHASTIISTLLDSSATRILGPKRSRDQRRALRVAKPVLLTLALSGSEKVATPRALARSFGIDADSLAELESIFGEDDDVIVSARERFECASFCTADDFDKGGAAKILGVKADSSVLDVVECGHRGALAIRGAFKVLARRFFSPRTLNSRNRDQDPYAAFTRGGVVHFCARENAEWALRFSVVLAAARIAVGLAAGSHIKPFAAVPSFSLKSFSHVALGINPDDKGPHVYPPLGDALSAKLDSLRADLEGRGIAHKNRFGKSSSQVFVSSKTLSVKVSRTRIVAPTSTDLVSLLKLFQDNHKPPVFGRSETRAVPEAMFAKYAGQSTPAQAVAFMDRTLWIAVDTNASGLVAAVYCPSSRSFKEIITNATGALMRTKFELDTLTEEMSELQTEIAAARKCNPTDVACIDELQRRYDNKQDTFADNITSFGARYVRHLRDSCRHVPDGADKTPVVVWGTGFSGQSWAYGGAGGRRLTPLAQIKDQITRALITVDLDEFRCTKYNVFTGYMLQQHDTNWHALYHKDPKDPVDRDRHSLITFVYTFLHLVATGHRPLALTRPATVLSAAKAPDHVA